MRPSSSPKDTWHQSTRRGNTEYELACYGDAIVFHNQALDHARHQFTVCGHCCFGQALSKVLISYFSLADCYRALHQSSRAGRCYIDALKFLQCASQQLPPAEGALESVLQAGSHLHTLWCEFVRECSEVPDSIGLEYHQGSQALYAALTQHAVHH